MDEIRDGCHGKSERSGNGVKDRVSRSGGKIKVRAVSVKVEVVVRS